MKEFLTRLKLIDNLTTTLQMSKIEFVNRLSDITDEGSTGVLSDTVDAFSSSKKEYKGKVDINSFKIKRRRRFFDTKVNFAIANGTYVEENGQLTINTEINGFNNFIIAFYAFLIIFYSAFIFISLVLSKNKEGMLTIPFILIHATFMFGLPYLIMRRSVKRLKYDLDREFFYLTKSK